MKIRVQKGTAKSLIPKKGVDEILQKSLKEISDYKHALDVSSIVAITDQIGIIQYVNDNFCKISKYRKDELIGQDHSIINSGYHSKEFIRDLWITIGNGKIWKGEIRNMAKDGTLYWVDTTIVPFLNEVGKPYQYIAIRADITERKRVEELLVANVELVFKNEENEKRASELIIVNNELAFQNEEKEKRAAELKVANKELAFQSEEKEKRAAELIIANTELAYQNNQKHKRADELIVANKELDFQNDEKQSRAEELTIANKELIFQNQEKEKRAAELIVANKELAFQNSEKQNRADELLIANKELVFQSEEKERRAEELLLANKELLFQNDEKAKREAELSETLERVSFLATIADNIQDPVISTTTSDGSDFIITRWNKPAEKLFEWKSDEAIGKNAAEIFKTDYPYETREQIFESWKTNGFWHGELIYHTKSGKPVPVLSTLSFLRDAAGNITGNLVLVRDITARKKAEEKLKEFQHFFNNSNDFSCIANKEGYFEILNPSFEKVMGYSQNELSQNPFIDFVHPDDIPATLDEYEKLKSGATVIHFSNRYRKKDGSYLWFDWNASPNPETGKLYCIARDVTERKKTEMALSKLNEELEQRVRERTEAVAKTLQEKNIILESIGDAFFAVDKDWIVTYWNRIAEIALHVHKQEILGKNLWEIFKDSIDSESYKKYHQAISTNQVVHFEDYYPTLNRWYEISAYPSGNGLSVYFKDVTERKGADEEIKGLNESLEVRVAERTKQLETANKELEAFSYSVSHDLRAPLRAVNSYARMLKEDYGVQLGSEASRVMNNIVSNAVKMSQLIDDLLAFSRLGRKELQRSKVMMTSIVADVCGELKEMEGQRNINYSIGDLLPAQADNILIKQVWINLISNALKYSKLKEKSIIEIGSASTDQEIIYHVKDNGVGFNMRYADKLFGVFQRLHSEDEFEGTGVGLAIVQRIVLKHGGRVWAEAKVNEGATFYFSLPKTNS